MTFLYFDKAVFLFQRLYVPPFYDLPAFLYNFLYPFLSAHFWGVLSPLTKKGGENYEVTLPKSWSSE